jgi:hypothetical protein
VGRIAGHPEQAVAPALFFVSRNETKERTTMPTDRQRDANYANAKKSTGPRTAEGKAASSANALKFGIYAKSRIIPGEDPAKLQALHDDLYRTYNPQHADERILLDAMIANAWHLERLNRCFDELWNRYITINAACPDFDKDHPVGQAFPRHEDSFAKLRRMIDSCERNFHRSLTALQRLQQSRQTVDPEADKPKLASFRQKRLQPAPPPDAPTPDPRPLAPAPALTAAPITPYAETSESNVENEVRSRHLSRP